MFEATWLSCFFPPLPHFRSLLFINLIHSGTLGRKWKSFRSLRKLTLCDGIPWRCGFILYPHRVPRRHWITFDWARINQSSERELFFNLTRGFCLFVFLQFSNQSIEFSKLQLQKMIHWIMNPDLPSLLIKKNFPVSRRELWFEINHSPRLFMMRMWLRTLFIIMPVVPRAI